MRYVQAKEAAVFKFTGPTPTDLNLPFGYEWVQINQENVDEFFTQATSEDWRVETYKQLLDDGHMGFLIHDQVGWAAVQWIATPASTAPPHLTERVTKRKFWCFNEHTREEHRRVGLWRALKTIGAKHVRNFSGTELTPIYSDTGLDNSPSRKAHESFGFEPHGILYRVHLRIPKVTSLKWAKWDRAKPHPRLE